MKTHRSEPPIVFLAFANDREAYLSQLREEEDLIRDTLATAEDGGYLKVHNLGSTHLDDIFEDFNRFRNRIAIFHYGGHANGEALQLEDQHANATGLAQLLAQQQNLQLVFLNGCATGGQVEKLLELGVKAVVATSNPIDDTKAQTFARYFYLSLSQKASIQEAFDVAKSHLITSNQMNEEEISLHRSLGSRKKQPKIAPQPWGLFSQSESALRWSLDLPYFGLPALPDQLYTKLPDDPFIALNHYTREKAPLFFGRNGDIYHLYQSVQDENKSLILYYGESGVGKSSLLDAGLLPRLHDFQVCYLRRDVKLGLLGSVQKLLDASSHEEILAAWQAKEIQQHEGKQPNPSFIRILDQMKEAFNREAEEELEELFDLLRFVKDEKTVKPFLLILDQVEEAFTRGSKQELEELFKLLHFLLVPTKKSEQNGTLEVNERFQKPKIHGKIILGYRKEYHAEIENLCRKYEIPYHSQFVESLRRENIIEIVEGVSSEPRLYEKYHLSLEPGLADRIADDLVDNTASAIPPVLQTLLTKMWEVAREINPESPLFSVDLYENLRKQGILLDDFLQEKIEAIRACRPEAVESGLLLDLLHRHTTPMGTGGICAASDLEKNYSHLSFPILELLAECQTHYLLLSVKQKEQTIYALAHDTLAPLIIKRFNQSQLPGQIAYRILENRKQDLIEFEPDQILFNKQDLITLEAGIEGMRRREAHETKAIQANQKLIEDQEQAYAEKNRKLQEQLLISESINLILEYQHKDPTLALHIALKAYWQKQDDKNILRLIRQNLNKAHYRLLIQEPWGSFVAAIAVAPNGEFWLSVGGDGKAKLRDQKGNLIRETKATKHGLWAAAFAPDSQSFLTGSSEGVIRHIDLKGKILLKIKGHTQAVTALTFSPDGQHILSGSSDHTVSIWDLTGKKIQTLIGHQDWVSSVAISPDGQHILTGSGDRTAKLWNWQGEIIHDFNRLHAPVNIVAFSPDGKSVLTGGGDFFEKSAEVRRWNLEGHLLSSYKGHQGTVNAAAFSPDGKYIITGADDHKIRLWNLKGRMLKVLQGHQGWIEALAFSPDGQSILSSSDDESVRVWEIQGKVQSEFPKQTASIVGLGYAQDGDKILIATEDFKISLWNQAGECLEQFSGPQSIIEAAALSPDGERVLTGGADQCMRLWDTKGNFLKAYQGHSASINAVVFSPDGKKLLSASEDGTARLWKMTGSQAHIYRGHVGSVEMARFSADGQSILTASADNTCHLWDLQGKVLQIFNCPDNIQTADLSLDGKYLLTGSPDRGIHLWNQEAEILLTFGEQLGGVIDLAFSPDGNYILSGHKNGMIKLWNRQGREIQNLEEDSEAIDRVAFSPDGYLMMVAFREGEVKVWRRFDHYIHKMTHQFQPLELFLAGVPQIQVDDFKEKIDNYADAMRLVAYFWREIQEEIEWSQAKADHYLYFYQKAICFAPKQKQGKMKKELLEIEQSFEKRKTALK